MRKQWNSVQRFSLRKFSTGLASVLLATMFMSQGVMAQTNEASENPKNTEELVKPDDNALSTVQPKATEGIAPKKVETPERPKPTTTLEKEKIEEPKVTFDTTKLEALIKEVEGLELEKYTEESVKELNVRLSKAKDTLVNAKSQKEIDSAYNALVGYKNSSLKRVPKLEENNTPKPDTTGGKETVGKKAENTEPNGTNIAGHNHSLAGTTLPEGSGFRTAPAGDVTFYLLDGSMETEAGRAPDARYILKFRRGQGYIPQYSSATTTGAYLDYTGQRREGEFILRTFATRGSNAEVGTYDFRLRFTDSKTGEVYVDQSLRVNVKPNKPTVTVENLENAAGKRAVVNSTARNSNDSVVEFYLNNIKKATITAVNGNASWTPDEALQAGDQITTKNIARDRERIPATYGGDINVERSTSDMSNAVTIPVPTTPTADKAALQAEIARETETKATAQYKNADQDKKEAYDRALTKAKDVMADGAASQEEANTAKTALEGARTALNGQATNKADLQAEIARETETKATAQYKNADQDKKEAYDRALTKAKDVMADGAASQEEANTAKTALEGARTALNGQATNKADLQAEIARETETKATAQYKNADQDKKEAYDRALTKAKDVMADGAASQEEANTAKTALEGARTALNGQATNKDALEAEINQETATKATAQYKNADQGKKEAYDNAVESGKAIFNRADATQTEVNDAVTAIANAKNALNGKETNRPQSDNDMMKALFAKKSEAKMLIEQEAMKKKAEISQAELSESEKALLDARVDQEKAKAFQTIDQATTIEEVNQALKAGTEAIRSIAVASANGRMTYVTPEESEEAMSQAHRQALPQTGTGNEVAIFGAAASAILAGLGLVVPSKKKED